MSSTRSENLKLIRLMNYTHEHTAEKLKSVVSNECKLSDLTNDKRPTDDHTARGIEKVLGLPKGWLDRDNMEIIKSMSQIDFDLVQKLSNISDEAKVGLYKFIDSI
tara:strand:- start:1065 stop:1382 length:318 start_codon:yes stop_codon:yes gene_type:complete